jgi:hypothetical protein
MSLRNNYVIGHFLLGTPQSVKARNLTYLHNTSTLHSYGAIIAFRLNGVVYVNGATKRLSGVTISKTTAGHINRVIELADTKGQAREVYHPTKFDLLYQSVVKTREATSAYMVNRKKELF